MLIVLKDDRMKDKEKKRDVDALLGKMPDERFAQLVNLGKKLTDWSNDQVQGTRDQHQGGGDDEMDETIGVNVMIGDEDEEEEEENDMHEIDDNDEEEDDDEEGAQNAGAAARDDRQQVIKGKVGVQFNIISNYQTLITVLMIKLASSDLDTSRSSAKSNRLQAHEIDAFWLQRKLSKIYDDPTQAQSKVREVLDILKKANDEREVENKLVLLLGFDQFEFIKLLRSNRQMSK